MCLDTCHTTMFTIMHAWQSNHQTRDIFTHPITKGQRRRQDRGCEDNWTKKTVKSSQIKSRLIPGDDCPCLTSRPLPLAPRPIQAVVLIELLCVCVYVCVGGWVSIELMMTNWCNTLTRDGWKELSLTQTCKQQSKLAGKAWIQIFNLYTLAWQRWENEWEKEREREREGALKFVLPMPSTWQDLSVCEWCVDEHGPRIHVDAGNVDHDDAQACLMEQREWTLRVETTRIILLCLLSLSLSLALPWTERSTHCSTKFEREKLWEREKNRASTCSRVQGSWPSERGREGGRVSDAQLWWRGC